MNRPINWSPGITLEGMEKQIIREAFRFYRGNKTQCSISLGISIRTLENKLEKYETEGKAQRESEDAAASERDEQLRRARGIVGRAAIPQAPPTVYGATSGFHMEPPPEVSAQQPVPVPQRQEVQAVLPKHAASSSQSRRR